MTDGDLTVEVWVRDHGAPPGDPRKMVRNRLENIRKAGLIEEFSVAVWGRSAAFDGDESNGSRVHSRLATFRQWAARTGHELEPAFQRCRRSSLVTEGTTTVIRLPIVCLAIYEDGKIRTVAPCMTDEGVLTVADALDRLEQGRVPVDYSA